MISASGNNLSSVSSVAALNSSSAATAHALGPSASISSTSIKALSDRSYEKRKAGAVEIEGIVKALLAEEKRVNSGSATESLSRIIRTLANDFIINQNSNKRKGGLIGLAAVAIGMGAEVDRVLNSILPPVLKCIDDPDARVRYYATESLYNILKVARSRIFPFFNSVFDVLCRLFTDVDPEVVHGAHVLDRLLKDLIPESEGFEVDTFIPLLQKYLKMTNPHIRQLLIGWITALDAVPDIDMIKRLPDFLDGLFNMLSDTNKEIQHAADTALNEFLLEVKETPNVNVIPCVPILVSQCQSSQNPNKLKSLSWILDFVDLTRDQLVPCASDLFGAVVRCVSDKNEEIQKLAQACNKSLRELIEKTNSRVQEANFVQIAKEQVQNHSNQIARIAGLDWLSMLLDKVPKQMDQHVDDLMPVLLASLSDPVDDVVLLTLGVLARVARNTNQSERILSDIMNLFAKDRDLLESRGSVIIRQMCVLLRPTTVYLILSEIIEKDTRDLPFLSLMVQTLNIILLTATELSELRRVLKDAAIDFKRKDEKLKKNDENDKVKSFLGLISSPIKKDQVQEENGMNTNSDDDNSNPDESPSEVFTMIFKAWCHNAVSALSLCLLGQSYPIASRVTMLFPELEVSVDMLVNLDKLIQLFESPIYLHVRMQLLATGEDFQPELLQCLNGILMLLPQQSTAFKILSSRLQAVTSMQLVLGNTLGPSNHISKTDYGSLSSRGRTSSFAISYYQQLVSHFIKIQNLHTEAKAAIVNDKSLLSKTKPLDLGGYR